MNKWNQNLADEICSDCSLIEGCVEECKYYQKGQDKCIENNRLRKLVNKKIKEYVENDDHGNIYTYLEFAKHGRHKCNI